MSKILRKTQSIFGSSSGTNQIAQFGSLAAASPTFTTDPIVIQSLNNYLVGWFDAVIGGNSPAIEDMNALCYLYAYQLAYGFQAGVPEWDNGTTYYTGSLVQSGGIMFMSLTDSNLNNPITDDTNWSAPLQNGVLTTNLLPSNTVIISGQTLTWSNLIIPSAKTLTVNSGSYYEGIDTITINGTMTINGKSRII